MRYVRYLKYYVYVRDTLIYDDDALSTEVYYFTCSLFITYSSTCRVSMYISHNNMLSMYDGRFIASRSAQQRKLVHVLYSALL